MFWTAGVAFSLVAAAGHTRAFAQTYVFDTTTGVVTMNGSTTNLFQGVAVVDRGVNQRLRSWSVQGDMNVGNGVTVQFVGSNLAEVRVGGNLRIYPVGLVTASAVGMSGGSGGGNGGAGGAGAVDGGAGGSGGGAGTFYNGSLGANGSGSTAGVGGALPRRGGNGGAGTTSVGNDGATGEPRVAGMDGQAGASGASGSLGGFGVGNSAFGSPAGTGGTGGSAGVATPVSGGAGVGGSGGANFGNNGNSGGSGMYGANGAPGGNGGAGTYAADVNSYAPTWPASMWLSAGNGGHGGGGGGHGGGGSGGSSGAAGGGGGAGAGNVFTRGGGGGGGGAGGAGAQGIAGGTGGNGGRGGGAGGGVQFTVNGRIQNDGAISATGADGWPGFSGQYIETATAGGTGGSGGSAGNTGASTGGVGGRGGDGGASGASGRGGNGGAGSSGAGGGIMLLASQIAGTGRIDLRGGFFAPAGRLIYQDAVTAPVSFNYAAPPAQESYTTLYLPRTYGLYFAMYTPNIVPTSIDLPGLDGGPGPYGLLPASLNDPVINAGIAAAPSRARLMIVRYNAGPAGFALSYNNAQPDSTTSAYDMYVIYRLGGAGISVTVNNWYVAKHPFTSMAEFGGNAGNDNLPSMPIGRAWACLGPATGTQNILLGLGGLTGTVAVEDPADAPTVTYLFEACGTADVGRQGGLRGGDGVLDNNDFIAFIGLFFDANAAADVGVQGGGPGHDGQFDNNDFIAFINAFFAGCS
ncbi:MAG: GC-type dockerin domain-anchored protein [Phycisphaerales bacterium]